MDRGAWRATIHRVAKSQTWLKQLHTHMKRGNAKMNLRHTLVIFCCVSNCPQTCCFKMILWVRNLGRAQLCNYSVPSGILWGCSVVFSWQRGFKGSRQLHWHLSGGAWTLLGQSTGVPTLDPPAGCLREPRDQTHMSSFPQPTLGNQEASLCYSSARIGSQASQVQEKWK